VEALGHREWPVVFSHGDFVPWNVLSTNESNCQAVDWEYGTLEGFPYLDLAYYVLQLGCLLHRWNPRSASDYTVRFLTDAVDAALTEQEAQALVALTAYHALQLSLEDGKDANEPMQVWWKAVWEAKQ
jgi:thiamine kinase-like enzyme